MKDNLKKKKKKRKKNKQTEKSKGDRSYGKRVRAK